MPHCRYRCVLCNVEFWHQEVPGCVYTLTCRQPWCGGACCREDVAFQVFGNRVCRRNGCGMPLRNTRYSLSNQLCKTCFTEEEQKTWQTICPRLSKENDWTDKTLFLGNLHYKCLKSELEDFVRKLLDRPSGLPDNFEVKLHMGGKQGDHGLYKKVYKHFAHITFDIVHCAYALLQ